MFFKKYKQKKKTEKEQNDFLHRLYDEVVKCDIPPTITKHDKFSWRINGLVYMFFTITFDKGHDYFKQPSLNITDGEHEKGKVFYLDQKWYNKFYELTPKGLEEVEKRKFLKHIEDNIGNLP